jgi:hypothetical protein
MSRFWDLGIVRSTTAFPSPPLENPSFRPEQFASLRTAQRRTCFSTTAISQPRRAIVFAVACPFVCHPAGICGCFCRCSCFCRCTCRCRCLFHVVILTLSEVEWGRTPVFVVAFGFCLCLSFCMSPAEIYGCRVLHVISTGAVRVFANCAAEKPASRPRRFPSHGTFAVACPLSSAATCCRPHNANQYQTCAKEPRLYLPPNFHTRLQNPI